MRHNVFKRYVWGLTAVAGGGLLLVAVFNLLVNPFNLYDGPRLAGFNDYKYELAKHSRLSKAAEVRRLQPECLILGSSRAQVGLDPEHPGWSGCRGYNLAHNGGTLYEALRYFQHAAAVRPPRQAVLALDFLMFNVHRPLQQPGFAEERLLVRVDGTANPRWRGAYAYDLFAGSLSWQTLQASWATVSPSYVRQPLGPEDGFYEYTRFDAGFVARHGQRALFLGNERAFLTEHWFPPPRRRFATADTANGQDAYDYLRAMLRLAHRHQTDVRMLISPAHARQWEALDQAGLWLLFEAWKRALVAINDDEARRAGRAPFPLWDFSGFNSYTTEAVPAPGDQTSQMRWYWESSHYRKELGQRVLDRVFGHVDAQRPLAADFGMRLDGAGVERHLTAVRAAHERWRRDHPADVAEIRALAEETAGWRRP